jgi:hypothetical protein
MESAVRKKPGKPPAGRDRTHHAGGFFRRPEKASVLEYDPASHTYSRSFKGGLRTRFPAHVLLQSSHPPSSGFIHIVFSHARIVSHICLPSSFIFIIQDTPPIFLSPSSLQPLFFSYVPSQNMLIMRCHTTTTIVIQIQCFGWNTSRADSAKVATSGE